MKIQEQIKKKVVKFGNGSIVYTPKTWIGREVIVTLPEISLEEEIISVLRPYLDKIIGIYLYGSYARGEERKDSDVDVLVIAKDKFEVESSFDITVVENVKDKIEKDIFLYSIIKEAKPIFNGVYLEELNELKVKPKFDWFLESTKDSIKDIEELIELDKLDGRFISSYSSVYSLILRLRGMFLVKCVVSNKKFSNFLFKKWIVKHLSGVEFRKMYKIYKDVRDGNKSKVKLEIKSVEILLDFLKKEVSKW